MDRKNCPYCGEEIAATAKKCRFCGEWLEIEEAVLMPENADAAQIQEYASPAADIAVNGYTEGPLPAINVNGVPQQQYPQQQYPQQQYPQQQYPQQPMQQPVINIQVAQSQETNVSQEQTVTVEHRSTSSSGWLWFEILGVAGGVWGLTGHWWAGLITLIALGVALQIPVIGTLICVVLGCGLGLLAGVIAAALSAPTWACWLIGLVATGVMIGINIEDKNSDDFYD